MSFVTDENRDELGLPRKPLRRNPSRLLPVLAILAITTVFGFCAGKVYRIRAMDELERQLIALQAEKHPLRLKAALTQFQQSASRLISNPRTRLFLAHAYLYASSQLPQQSMYLNACLREIGQLSQEVLDPVIEADSIWVNASALAELKEDQAANVALNRLANLLGPALNGETKAMWQNAKAYLLATSNDPQVRDAKEALVLARDAISSSYCDSEGRTPSQMPEVLDTLAAAEFANGQAVHALQIQTVSLALVDSNELLTYLDHYDRYAQFVRMTQPQGQK